MSRILNWSAKIVALICCAGVQAAPSALSASPSPVKAVAVAAPKPVEIKVVSMLPAASAPAEVKVVALPASAVPIAVRVISAPEQTSGRQLVKATDWLVLATVVLAVLTGGVFVYTAVLAHTTSKVARS